MELKEALQKAENIKKILLPYCKRIEIAGSIRRGKETVKDIEIVAIPDKYYLEKYFIDNKFNYRFEKNGPKYKKFIFEGISVDLFTANPDNFGLQYLVRTGSAEFSSWMLSNWKKISGGGYSKDSYLHTADHRKMLTPEEADVFELCSMEFIEPRKREKVMRG